MALRSQVGADIIRRRATLYLEGSPKRGRSWKESPYLLTGLIKCVNCGYSYHGHVHRRNGVSYHYYEDSGFGLHGKSVCSQSMIPKDSIESFIKGQILQHILPTLDINRLRHEIEVRLSSESDCHNEKQDLKRQIGDVERKLENIRNAVAEGIDPKFFKAKIDSLNHQRAALEKELKVFQKADQQETRPDEIVDAIMNIARNLPDVLDTASPKKIKELFKHFVDRIEVDGKQRIATCYLYKIPNVNGKSRTFTGKRMPEVGLEPTWCCHRGILSPLRLPLSPLRHRAISGGIIRPLQARCQDLSSRNNKVPHPWTGMREERSGIVKC